MEWITAKMNSPELKRLTLLKPEVPHKYSSKVPSHQQIKNKESYGEITPRGNTYLCFSECLPPSGSTIISIARHTSGSSSLHYPTDGAGTSSMPQHFTRRHRVAISQCGSVWNNVPAMGQGRKAKPSFKHCLINLVLLRFAYFHNPNLGTGNCLLIPALACSLACLAFGHSELPSIMDNVLMLLPEEDTWSTGEELAGCRAKATGSWGPPWGLFHCSTLHGCLSWGVQTLSKNLSTCVKFCFLFVNY